MIRINLLPQRELKRQAGSQTFVALALFLIVVELLGGYLWLSAKEDELAAVKSDLAQVKKLDAAEKKFNEEMEVAKAAHEEALQRVDVGKRLLALTGGPVEMLQYLSYILTRRDTESEVYREQIQDQETAGWHANWNPDRVWLDKFHLDGPYLTIEGIARDHDDVAEFLYRIDSGIYFVNAELISTVRKKSRDWDELQLVEFELAALFNHDQNGMPKYLAVDLPPEFDELVQTPKQGKKKAGGKKAKGGAAKGQPKGKKGGG